MKRLQDLLKHTREKLNLSIEDVVRDTKIKKSYVEALERGEFEKLPSISTTKGFLKIYANYLGLNSEEVIAILRRESKEEEKHMIKNLQKRVKIPHVLYNKYTLSIILISFIVVILSVYAYHEYVVYKTPPTLNVYFPKNEFIKYYQNKIKITGATNPGNKVKIEGYTISNVSLNGNFSATIGLLEGTNKIQISSTNILGIINKKTIYIDYINKITQINKTKNTFYIMAKDKNSPTYINATTEGKTIFNHILGTGKTIKLKGIYNIILNIGNIQNIALFYSGKPITISGSGFSILVVKFKNNNITISKSN